MPIPFPSRDPEGGPTVQEDYWTVDELADMFHMSAATVRRRIRSGEWEVFEPVARTYYMNAAQVAAAMAAMTHRVEPDPPDLPEAPTRLGVPVADTDLEGIR
jgi:hypothetical protein